MHHSSLATITEKGIKFSTDLLTPLSIRDETPVWAAYYPTPEKYNLPEKYHDLMITAVPYDCWLFAGRFRVWLRQEIPGGLNELTDVFKRKEMSIIYSEASRSAHRYATCTITVCVDALMHEYSIHANSLTFEMIREIKNKVSARISDCVSHIEKCCSKFHFSDQEALGLEKPVKGERLDSLSYFYERINNSKINNKGNVYSKPWRFTCRDGILYPEAETTLFIKSVMGNSLPSRAFAELNTREAQLRLAVIPVSKLQSFGWVVVSYEWHNPNLNNFQRNPNNECSLNILNKDIVSEITKKISKRHNIWRFFTHVKLRNRDSEGGNLEFFVSLINQENDYAGQWDSLEKSLKSDFLEAEGAKITRVSVTPIAFKRIFVSTRTDFPMKDELLSICAEVGSKYGMLPEDFIMVETHVNPVIQTIVDAIHKCQAMIQYYGDISASTQNDWLHAELLAAEVLRKPVVLIIEGQDTPREMIRTLGDKAPIKIPRTPTRQNITSAIEKALGELHKTRLDN